MAQGAFVPEIVVGIDFGMTCTGIAYSMAPEWAAPRTIQHWPGKLGFETRNKVDTLVAYDAEDQRLVEWGFGVDRNRQYLDIQELFKLWLDPAYHDGSADHSLLEEARRWFSDYMECLHGAIEDHFDDSYARWRDKKVEYLFSVPTTWKDPAMIAETEKLIKAAGFANHSSHYVRISLTEAEAAAVFVAKETGYRNGDVFLVCDAGGGTTDVNVLKVQSASSGRIQLQQLSWVEGKAVGSALIDFKVGKLVQERLRLVKGHLSDSDHNIAERMLRDRFETFKCSFGTKAQTTLDLFLPVPDLESGWDFPEARIRDSRMVITRQEIQQIFDEQIDKIFGVLDREIISLQQKLPSERISYLVLSGGLGSSPYLKQKLRKRYELGEDAGMYNARNIKILTAREPQLVVCHGLVMDQVQEIKNAFTAYAERCCRNSYGIVVRQLYDANKHQGEDIMVDPRDKKKWAERQIHWFIRQGESVSVKDGITNHYRLKIDHGSENVPWKTQIVMSSLPPQELPKSMKHEGAKRICSVEAQLGQQQYKLKNHRWYNLGSKYFRADFDVRILIGSADMRFQILANGQVVSREHEEIEVVWDPPERRGTDDKIVVQELFGIYQELV